MITKITESKKEKKGMDEVKIAEERIKCNNLVLSRNATFILQSKTIQSILEQVYDLSSLVRTVHDGLDEHNYDGLEWIKILDILDDIDKLKKCHLKTIATIQGDALEFLLDEVSLKYKNKLIKDINKYRQVHMKKYKISEYK